MAKHPTKPGITTGDHACDGADFDAEKRRSCWSARAALAKTEQVAQLLDEHLDEDGDQFDEFSKEVSDLRRQMRNTDEHVGNLRVEIARMSAIVAKIGDVLHEQNHIKHVAMIAEVETGKAQKIAAIADTSDSKKAIRVVMRKIALLIITVVGALLGVIIERYR